MKQVLYEVAEISVIYKGVDNVQGRRKIIDDESAFKAIRQGFDMDTIALQEQFVVMYLNHGNRVLGLYRSSKGGLTGTIADIRLILSVALKIVATGILIAHNHPSGTLNPSQADQVLTEKLKQSAALMDIQLVDHLILDNRADMYYSFAGMDKL